MRLLLLTSLFILSCNPYEKSGTKIVGGSPVTAGQNHDAIGATAAILDSFGTFFCTGTLVRPRVVLTAAHCIVPGHPPAFVTFEINALAVSNERKIAVRAFQRSPTFNPSTHDEDWAYLTLEQDAQVTPAEIASASEASHLIKIDNQLLMVGYGITQSHGNIDGTKRKVSAKVAALLPKQFQGNSGTDTCQGDSGGPVFALTVQGEWRVVGITSWGIGCSGGGYYGRAALAACWMADTLGQEFGPIDPLCDSASPIITPIPPLTPTATPLASPAQEQVLIDDYFFRVGTNLGSSYGVYYGNIGVEQEAAVGSLGKNIAALLGPPQSWWSNFAVEGIVDMSKVVLLHPDIPSFIGLVGRMSDITNFYYAGMMVSSNGSSLVMGKMRQGRDLVLKSIPMTDKSGKVKLVMVGSNFRVYLNGALALSGSDSDMAIGVVGFAINNYAVGGSWDQVPRLENFRASGNPSL